jgi:PAS domain S-box-containing protein
MAEVMVALEKGTLNILLVEDDEHDRVAFCRALERSEMACQVTACARAEEALERVHAHASAFDIAAIDHGLPGMSGLDLCRRILETTLSLPLVILTGRGSQQLAVEALKAGVDDYVIKDPGQQYLQLLPVVLSGVLRQHGDRLARKEAEDALRKAHDELEKRVAKRTAKLAETTEQLKQELSERKRAEKALAESTRRLQVAYDQSIIYAKRLNEELAERKRIEEFLRLREERFRSVAQTASDAIITVNSDGEIVFWNQAAERIFGYSADDVMGHSLSFLMPERFRKDHRKAVKEAVCTGRSNLIGRTVEMVGLGRSGEEFPVELSLATWKTEEGKFFTGIVRDITGRKRAEQEIRHLSRQLIKVSEEEKKRIARDLHDEFGQDLTALHFGVEALQSSFPESLKSQKQSCEELVGLVEKLGDNIRKIASELRPGMLDHLGLVPTLKWFIDDFGKRVGGLEIGFQAVGIKGRPDPEIEIILYRVLQEALNNIAKHAKASRVDVVLTYSHPELIFTIKDNGVGLETMDPGESLDRESKGIGLLGMRERVGSVGGTCDIVSNKGKGTMIRAKLPFAVRKTEGSANALVTP